MTATSLSIGFIGMGAIGAPMAQRILDGGLELWVWNRTPAKMHPLLDQGAIAAASPQQLGDSCDVVLTCLTDAAALEAVLFGPQGIATSRARARLLVDTSTISPHVSRELAGRLHGACGMRWLDAPVSGGPVGARAGTLASMAGGDAADLELARPAIMSDSNRLTHMGALGSGQATKACNQLLNFIAVAAVAETLHLAEGFGLDANRIPEAVAGGFADMPILREYARGKAAGETRGIVFLVEVLRDLHQGRADPAAAGRLQILHKDMAIVEEMSRACAHATPVFELVQSLYRRIGTAPLQP